MKVNKQDLENLISFACQFTLLHGNEYHVNTMARIIREHSDCVPDWLLEYIELHIENKKFQVDVWQELLLELYNENKS